MSNLIQDNQFQDPDPFTVIGVGIAGLALLLNLEQKIKQRQAREKDESKEQAINSSRLRLEKIGSDLSVIENLLSSFISLGELHEMDRGVYLGQAAKFLRENEYPIFNEKFRLASISIGNINEQLYAINVQAIPLDEDLYSEISQKIKLVISLTDKVLIPTASSYTRLSRLLRVYEKAKELVHQLAISLGSYDPPMTQERHGPTMG